MERTRTHWSQWVMTALGTVWLAVFPLWQDGSFSRITRAKWVGMLILTGVTLVVTAAMVITLWCRREARGRIRLGWVHVAALAYFVLVALSAWLGTWAMSYNNRGELTVWMGAIRYEGLLTQLCYGAIFLCMSLSTVNIRRLLDASAVTLMVFCAVTAMQYADMNPLGLFPMGRSVRTNYEFQGTIGNIDMISGYLCIVVPALLGGVIKAGRGGWQWLLPGLTGVMLMLCMEVQSGLIVLGLLVLLLTLLALRDHTCRSRTAVVLGGMLMLVSLRLLLGLPWLDGTENVTFPFAFATWKLMPLALGALLMAAAVLLHRRPGKDVRTLHVRLIALMLVLAVVLAVYALPLPEGNGLWELQELLHGRPQDSYGSERIGIWRMTLELSRENLLFGTGPDTFYYAMHDYMNRTGQSLVQNFDNPHNMLLAILSNNGIFALLAFAVLCVLVLVKGVKRAGREPMALPVLLAVGCYLVQGMFTFSICLVTPMFFAVLGMCAGPFSSK
ncbi:MAG: O-antigen ligase family protein [Clostridia bacterium]|nr:O-antigen ligase family protein [Clostridia bacterium]